jgi:putative membrane protein
MKKAFIPFCLAVALVGATSCGGGNSDSANSDSATSTSSTTTTTASDTGTSDSAGAMSSTGDTSMSADRDFVTEAASGGLMEVELGKTASTNAASPKVKAFGKMMVTDHTKANTELKAVAAKKNITIPSTPDEKHQGHINDLKEKKGVEFDKAYVDMMVDDHKEDVSKFEDEAKNAKDPDIKAFAAKTLPVLQKHLSSIQAIQSSMKK